VGSIARNRFDNFLQEDKEGMSHVEAEI